MEYHRPLDITVIAATDLKNVNMFMRMGVFVEAYVSSGDHNHEELLTTKRKTHVDTNGGCHPEWNYRFKFTVEETSIFKSFINFHLRAERGFFDRAVGEVRIPLRDLLQDCIDNKRSSTSQDHDHHIEAEYQVLTKGRKAKGSLKISFRFGERFVVDHLQSNNNNAAAVAVVTNNNNTITSNLAITPYNYNVDHHVYPPPPPEADVVVGGGYYPPRPYDQLHYSQPGVQYPVPSYPAAAAGGGYMYYHYYPPPPPLTYYPPPPPGHVLYNNYPAAGKAVTNAHMPAAAVVQPPEEQTKLVKVIRKKISAAAAAAGGGVFGSNMGLLGIGAGIIGGLLFGEVVSSTEAAAQEDSGDGDIIVAADTVR